MTESTWPTVGKELPPSSPDRSKPGTVMDGSSPSDLKCIGWHCRAPREIGQYCAFCALDLIEEQPEPMRAWVIHCFMCGHMVSCRGTIEAARRAQTSGQLRCMACKSPGVELERDRMWSLSETRHPAA